MNVLPPSAYHFLSTLFKPFVLDWIVKDQISYPDTGYAQAEAEWLKKQNSFIDEYGYWRYRKCTRKS